MSNVFERQDPTRAPVPLFFDSPHSGNIYPLGFETLVPHPILRQAEDAFVDELYRSAPDQGAVFLRALFPRSYIDLNRSLADMDPDLVEGGWLEGSRENRKVRMGSGLIWKTHYPDLPIYKGKLRRDDVEHRVNSFYKPYRQELETILADLQERFGWFVHVNCHSMPSVSSPKSPEGPGQRRPDIVLGDADGTSCDRRITDLARQVFSDHGYTVTVNVPYNGADLIRAHSSPIDGRHSLQIELNRALYMDEIAIEKIPDFARLNAATEALVAAFADFARSN